MAFDSLSEKLQNVFKNLRSKGRLTEDDVKAALKEVKMHPCRFLYGSADPVFTVPEIDRRNPAAPLYAAFFQNRCDLRCGNGVVGNHLDLHDDVGTVEQQPRCKQNSQRHPEFN